MGENIQRLRAKEGLTHQGSFAKKIGMPQSQLSDIENNRGVPTLETMIRVATGIGCRVEDIVRGTNPAYDAARAKKKDDIPSVALTVVDASAAVTELQARLAIVERERDECRDLVDRWEEDARRVVKMAVAHRQAKRRAARIQRRTERP